jgi:hypothetical protein
MDRSAVDIESRSPGFAIGTNVPAPGGDATVEYTPGDVRNDA